MSTHADDLESACRLAFGAYVSLQERAAALAPRSATARLLTGPGPAADGSLCPRKGTWAAARARQELEELRGVLAGTHGDPLVLEASQVWYWCCVSALSSGLRYDDFSPHRAWRGEAGDASAPECRRILADAGRAIAGHLDALEAVRYDLAQLSAKDYLADYFAQGSGP